MRDTIVITSVYKPFWGSDQFYRSCKNVGLPVFNAFTGKRFTGNGDVLKMIYEALLNLKDEYKYAIYSDGADSFFINSFTPPDNIILYSAEKACYPRPELAKEYPEPKTAWRFLNGGGYCGEIKLLIEFFEKYGLNKFKGDINGQYEQAVAYLTALKDGFPIMLDEECKYFQTIAFAEPETFRIDGIGIYNSITGSHPRIFHGNGRTDMEWIYKMYR